MRGEGREEGGKGMRQRGRKEGKKDIGERNEGGRKV